MKNFDFLTKELVDSFTYTTTTQNREAFTNVNVDGRHYTKWGTLQAVTIVGNLYRDCYDNKILVCGISKQHPCDTKCDKQIAYEVATLKALSNPDIIINSVPEHINNYNFSQMMSWYIDAMDLDFIKTRKEIEKTGDDPQKYNR